MYDEYCLVLINKAIFSLFRKRILRLLCPRACCLANGDAPSLPLPPSSSLHEMASRSEREFLRWQNEQQWQCLCLEKQSMSHSFLGKRSVIIRDQEQRVLSYFDGE